MNITIYTDGACKGNGKKNACGGYAAILVAERNAQVVKELVKSGGKANTTNNEMELLAVIEGLKALTRLSLVLTIVTDSKYVMDGITSWIHNWKLNNWRTSNRQPVKNAELWRELDALVNQHHITWDWTRGHSGHEWNEKADTIASAEAAKLS